MNAADLIPLSPYIVVAGTGLVAMLLLAIRRSHGGTATVTVVGLAVAGATAVWIAHPEPRQVTSLLVIDNFALYFTALMCAAGILVALLAYDYWTGEAQLSEEFYLLLLFAILGSAVLAASVHFASFFLGLEALSVSLYAMIAYQRTAPARERVAEILPAGSAVAGPAGLGIEAGIKYLVLAAVSAAFLLFGMALIYLDSGSMLFSGLAGRDREPTLVLVAGVCMILVGIGFKLALVPFHLWTPDVYEGAPVPTAAIVASVSKGAMFALLIRFFAEGRLLEWPRMIWLVTAVAVASMLIGNLLALQQKNIKRILAYSSIAHMGYLLVALVADDVLGVAAVAFYFAFYFISIIGAFGVVAVAPHNGQQTGDLSEYAGLAWRRPWLAAVLSAMLFSLAGIPLTAGFVGKFYILTAGIGASLWALVIVLVLSSVIGLYYYLRVIVAMYSDGQRQLGGDAEPSPANARHATPLPSVVTLTSLCLLLVWLGVYPTSVIHLVHNIAAGLR